MKKRGVSPIIGYVLLIVFAIVLGVIVYNWMRTYVPQGNLECPDGTSLFVKDYSCNNLTLNITLKNNGKFNVGGYFIYAATSPGQELATKDISPYVTDNLSRLFPNGIKFSGELNSLSPMDEETNEYNLAGFDGTVYSVEIVPIRWQKDGRLNRLVSCTAADIKETISCG